MLDVVPYSGLRQFGALLAEPTLTLLFVTSCSRPQPASQERTGGTVDVPQFAIAVKLSEQAEKRLHSIGESVLVVAYFDGDALPGQGKYEPPNRDVVLGNDEKMVDRNNVATFHDSRVPLNDWNRLSDKNYFVTINTVSARKAAKDNLLDCADPLDRRIESFKNKTIEVQCWLIGEPSAPTKTFDKSQVAPPFRPVLAKGGKSSLLLANINPGRARVSLVPISES
jgi:hypothetical protein